MANMSAKYLFNGPVEVGLRTLLLLLVSYPRSLDLQRLVVLDYLLVHSGDYPEGPPSLHAPSPLRAGEVAIRRDLIQKGLLLMASRGLVRRSAGDSGFSYAVDSSATILLDALQTPYVRQLRERATWAVDVAGQLSDTNANALLGKTTERWKSEFVSLTTQVTP